MDKVVEFNNIGFSYTKEIIFSNISFSAYKGDFLALIGANGAGKSTLLKLLLGEINSSSGDIKLFGEDIRRFRNWTKIGYVPQNIFSNTVNFPATAYEIVLANLFSKIGFLRFPKKEHIKKAKEALRLLNMERFAKRLIGELSGGQMQRVFLARTIVADPEILILDEPTSGIDSHTVEYVYRLLFDLNKNKNLTVIMVTHDVARVSEYSSRTLCLENGSIVELNKSQIEQELLYKHKHP